MQKSDVRNFSQDTVHTYHPIPTFAQIGKAMFLFNRNDSFYHLQVKKFHVPEHVRHMRHATAGNNF